MYKTTKTNKVFACWQTLTIEGNRQISQQREAKAPKAQSSKLTGVDGSSYGRSHLLRYVGSKPYRSLKVNANF